MKRKKTIHDRSLSETESKGGEKENHSNPWARIVLTNFFLFSLWLANTLICRNSFKFIVCKLHESNFQTYFYFWWGTLPPPAHYCYHQHKHQHQHHHNHQLQSLFMYQEFQSIQENLKQNFQQSSTMSHQCFSSTNHF